MDVNTELLKELRIDRTSAPSRRIGFMMTGAAASLLLLGVAGWAYFSRDNTPEVHTAHVLEIGSGTSNPSVLDASGYVVARRMATISAKVTGRVREVLIEEGQRVAAGDVMATLDPVDASAQRDLAAAQLSATRAQSGSIEAQLHDAEKNAVRLGILAQQQLISRSQYEQSIAERDSLRAQLTVTNRNAMVADRQLRIAENGVDNTVVRAPFAGMVVTKSAQPGEIISPLSAGGGFTRTGIGTIVDMDSLEVEVDVSEAFIGRVQAKMPVEAMLNAYPDWKIPAEVIAIIPTADRAKATVKIRIALKQKDPRIVPDMGVRVSFLQPTTVRADHRKPGVLVPSAAITSRGGREVAYVVADGRVAQRALKIGRTVGEGREVLSGVAAGDSVVLDPPPELTDGAQVRIAPDPSGKSARAGE